MPIYIGTPVGSGFIGAITTDVSNRAKRWALRRYEAKRNATRGGGGKGEDHAKGERSTIDGPDGQVLKSWTVDKDGEHETDGE